jgi:hypothetical protein
LYGIGKSASVTPKEKDASSDRTKIGNSNT